MKLALLVLFALFAVALAHATQSPAHHDASYPKEKETSKEREKITKVNVTVYYETLCSDSVNFITTQVYPLVSNHNKSISHYLNVTFVPFGKSKFNKSESGYTFECHHGEEECEGNKYHACAIKHITNKDILYSYINCTATLGLKTKGSNYSAGKQCADELKVDFDTLNTCVNGTEGADLLAMYGNQTLDLKLDFVPSVTFNNVHNKEKQSEALKNLQGVLCKEIPNSGKLIAECAGTPNSAPSVMSGTFVMLMTTLVASRLY